MAAVVLRISVVIPTYNRLASLQRVLAALARQDLPASEIEVVVVDDGSTDATRQWLAGAAFPFRLTPVFQHNQGPGAARNTGVAQAQGELIVFLDDDVAPIPTMLSEHLRAHAAHGPGAVVIGPMLPPPGFELSPWVRWSQDRLAEQYHAMQAGDWEPTARQFYTGNASLARGDFQASGGFDARLKRAEDVELAFRLAARGMQFVFHPAAVGYHFEERSFEAWLKIPYAYGRSDVDFSRNRGQAWLLPTLRHEYRQRSWWIRFIVRLCLDRPRRRAWATNLFYWLARAGHGLRWPLLTRLACSSLFNLHHYQGVADGLGGRRYFYNILAADNQPSTPAVA